jgi:hypothetical protein
MVAIRSDSQLAFLGRVFWMMAGPACLLICIVLILSAPRTGWRTGADIVYWIALAGMIGGRWVEHLGGNPRNALGEPATAVELRRYILIVAIAGPVLWVVANVVTNHVLGG